MKMKLKKAFSDLRKSPGRTLLVIVALILGIWGVGTLLVSKTVLTKDLNANYQMTRPAQVILYSKDFAKLNLQEFNSRKEIESAEFRDFSLHRIEVYPDQWIPLWLYGVEDFENYKLAEIFQEKGNKVPVRGTMLVERDGVKVSNLAINTSPRVRVGSKTIKFPISGIAFDPAQAPATQDAFIYAYTDKKTYSEITGLPNNERLIVRLKNVHSEKDVQNVTNGLVNDLGKNDINIISVEIPKFNEHPHQWQLNTILLLIGSIGLLAFIMGAVLVSQLMRSIMASQVRQIGIMKAIGGSRTQIFQIYIIMLVFMGIIAGLVGIPLAIMSGKTFSYFVAAKLNFNILTTSIPHDVYVYLILLSVLLPLILSLSFLLKGTKISVREALSDYGIKEQIKTFQLFKKWRLPAIFNLALRNSLRNGRRLAVTILAMALGVAIFSTGFNVRKSLWNLLSGLKNELRYDVQIVLNEQVSKEKALAPFSSIQNIKQIEAWVGGRGEIQSKLLSTDQGAGIVAVPVSTILLKLNIYKGRWLKPSNEIEVVMNQQAWETYKNAPVGSTVNLTIGEKTITAKIVGVTKQLEKPKIYFDINKYNEIFNPQHLINTLTFVAVKNDYEAVMNLKKELEKSIAGSDLNVTYVMSQAERVKIIYDHLDIILTSIVFLSFVVLMVSAIGMASATGINIWERTREIGVMRAIGAAPKIIYSLFVNEGMIISSLSILLGILIAYPLSWLAAIFFGRLMLGNGASLEYAFNPIGFWITLLVTILFGWMASRFPARTAVQIPTRQALAYE